MPTPLRVVQVIARLNVGGPAALVLSVAEGLDPESVDCVVLHGEVAGDEADWRDVRGSTARTQPVRGLGRAVRAGDDVRALADLVAALRRLRPDVVHTHTAKAGTLGRVAAAVSGTGAAVVHTFHGHVLHGYFTPTVTRGIIGLERALARRTDRIVTVGAQVREDLLAARIGRPEDYTVIPPGVEPPVTMPRDEARARLGLPTDAPVVAFVGRLTQIKRPDRAMDAVARLHAAGVDAHLVVAGDGDLRAAVEERAAQMGGRVHLLGWTPDVGTVVSAADVILLTSDNEGMPVTLVEAAFAGVPAVATDVGGVREVVLHERTGLVVPPQVGAVADGLSALLADDGLRRAMAARSVGHAEATFTTGRLVEAHHDLYREVARK